MTNYYDRRFQNLIDAGESMHSAAENTALAYLDGRQARNGMNVTRAERHAAFWSSSFLTGLPVQAWQSQAMTLALVQYFGQKHVANMAMLATVTPDVIVLAVRCSGLVLARNSSRRSELDQLAASSPIIAELCKVLDIFDLAHRERLSEVAIWQHTLAALSPLELLSYASLYAFEHLVPANFGVPPHSSGPQPNMQTSWDAINDILLWKLSTCADTPLELTTAQIGQSLAKHLSPFLSSRQGQTARHDLREAFANLLAAQTELNSFVAQSADAFSYDHDIEFVRTDNSLEIKEVKVEARAVWERDGRKLAALHNYWFYRAMDAFAASDMAARQIGSPKNHELNRVAYVKAMRTQLQLTEVYGVGTTVTNDAGESFPLFQTLLSLELMNVFFQRHFLESYVEHLRTAGSWSTALSLMAMQGLIDGNQNRLPLTWSGREAKISNMVGWTVTADHPQGSRRIAESIVDFWTSDWAKLSAQLRDGEPGLRPELFERPILKMGQTLVQLPWVIGLQNNSTAAINNFRRLGARRCEAGTETRRIEEQLGAVFRTRGFRVVTNWIPPAGHEGNAGEVDVICARDGIVLVLEVKSTYLRRSQQDAWRHATTTLRKAGQQLRRKLAAVQLALANQIEFTQLLGLEDRVKVAAVHGWIVDTSIECDHQRFGGFLKVSLEELLIALRDDRHLLHDPDGIFGAPSAVEKTLFPQGFNAARFVGVVESQAVWMEI